MRCDLSPLDDPRVRQAINLAVDKDALIREVLPGRGRQLNGPLSDRHFGRNPKTLPYPYDPESAKKLLREAGLRTGFSLNVHAPFSIPEEGPRLAENVALALKSIGIDAKVVLHDDRTEYARKIAEKELDGIFCFDSSPLGTYKVLNEKLDSRQEGTWWQGYESGEFNALLSEAVRTIADDARQEIYFRAYDILRNDAPWLFLYQSVRSWIGGKDIKKDRVPFDDLGYPVF
jgi:peptide/nickel transport system substrate-binding protein